MKLYLSSYRVPTLPDLIELVDKTPALTKVAILPNAKDYYSDRVRNIKAFEIMQYFLELGFDPEIVDLLDFSDPKELEFRLLKFDLLWGNGGNTFCLRHEMRRSGFDVIIKKLLKKGIVYGGESAGAVVAGTSLNDIENADEPEFAEEIIWEGLNLIPNYILPHVGNAFFEEANIVAKKNRVNDPSLIELTDYQALVIDGKAKRVVTAIN